MYHSYDEKSRMYQYSKKMYFPDLDTDLYCKKQPVWSVCLYSIGRALPGKSCVAYSTPSAFQDILEQLFGLASPFPHLGTGGAIG